MSVAKVLRLDEYRDRRTQRLRLAAALHRVEPLKHAVFSHLVQIADLAGADRVGAVWVDEYGSGMIHPYVVVDLLCDTPRRCFTPEPLHEAWQLGVPKAHDRPAATGPSIPATLAVALGSDGTRGWFVVAESAMPRPLLDAGIRDRIMFLAGECGSVVLHRDLDSEARRGIADAPSTFPGWPILEDLEGREEDEVVGARIARRFVVGRLVRMLVDDELAFPKERMAEQVRRARAELDGATVVDGHDELARCRGLLDALEQEDHHRLAADLVSLGDQVEAQGHIHGAQELYACAYSLAAALGAPRSAVDAARLRGRLLRRQAKWDEARRWFEVTEAIADAAGLTEVAARALVGLGGIKKELGNLPGAREAFGSALRVAEASGDRETIALAHHGLLGVEQALGNVTKGLQHGWLAVATYESEEGRTRCMASIAAALLECGDRGAAEDAWSLVAHGTNDRYYLVYAHDALGHLSALKGDVAAFLRHSARCDALGWDSALPAAKAEILLYRGLSYRALGQRDVARSWLTRAVRFAEDNGYNQTLFRAEEALRALDRGSSGDRSTERSATAPREVRDGLRAMRRELVGAGA